MTRLPIIARWVKSNPEDTDFYSEGRFLRVNEHGKLMEFTPSDQAEHFFYCRSNDNIPLLIGVSDKDLIEMGRNFSLLTLQEKYTAEFKQLEDAFASAAQ